MVTLRAQFRHSSKKGLLPQASQHLRSFIEQQERLSFSYPETGDVTRDNFPSGYDHDRNRCYLGKGETVFVRARTALMRYQHFPFDWTMIVPADEAPRAGLSLAVVFRQLGLWWHNGARVIEVLDKPDYYGFSYGTLSSHIERGEELFYVVRTANDEVFYGINAFSRPRFWGARLLKPYARSQQARFVRESMAQMQQLVSDE